MTVDQILCRASSNGELMVDGDGMITDKQMEQLNDLSKRFHDSIKGIAKPLTDNMKEEMAKLLHKRDNPELSTTCQKRLIKAYAEAYHGRTEDITSKYMEKGTLMEDDAITLFSRVTKTVFKKNELRLNNQYVTGHPDLGNTPDIREATEITDTKCSWSLITFLNAKIDKNIKKMYEWQGHTYLGLCPKAQTFRLAYCLVNSPAKLILDEKYRAMRDFGYSDPMMAETYPLYIERCKKIERNHIFDMSLFVNHNPGFDLHHNLSGSEWTFDIPMKDRLHQFVFARNEIKIESLYKRIKEGRIWLKNTFDL